MNRNYQLELDKLLEEITKEGKVPSLYLHACCAPCASYVLEYLSNYFDITIVYYNPNISSKSEYEKRLLQVNNLISRMPLKRKVKLISGEYDSGEFFSIAKGLENEPERGERCLRCYRQRLFYTANLAKRDKADYFATTLTLSPLKNASAINSIGEEISKELGTKYLCSDFKKRGGYLRSIELSKEYSLYRQNYCGCVYSMSRALENTQ